MPADVVATVNGQAITREQFEAELGRRSRAPGGQEVSSAQKEALLDELIRFEVLHQRAVVAGYEQDPQILASIKRMVVAKYQEDQRSKVTPPKITTEEVAEYHRTHPDRFGTPEKVRVALIELKVSRTAPPEKRAEVANRAEALRVEAAATVPADGTFGLLAQNHSEDQASRYRGGDAGWFTVGETNAAWDPAVAAAVFKLKAPGDLAPVVETPGAFYLVKLVQRQPARMRPLEEVKVGVEWLLTREKAQLQEQALYNQLREGLEIRTNHALLESIPLPADTSAPPAMPGALSAKTRTP